VQSYTGRVPRPHSLPGTAGRVRTRRRATLRPRPHPLCSLDVAFFWIGQSSPALATRLIDDTVRTRAIITVRPPRSLLGLVDQWRWHSSDRVAWILGKIARCTRPHTFRSGRRRRRRIIGCGYYPGRRVDGGGGGGRQEIFLAHGLVRGFHLGPHETSKPLCNNLDILVRVHATHIGLGTLFRGSLLKWKNTATLKTVTSGCITGQRRRPWRSGSLSFLCSPYRTQLNVCRQVQPM